MIECALSERSPMLDGEACSLRGVALLGRWAPWARLPDKGTAPLPVLATRHRAVPRT